MAVDSLPDWLHQRAQSTPERVALEADGLSCTFAELDARVDRAANLLHLRGMAAGDHVGMLAPNSPAYVLAVHALMRLGAVLVPLNTRLSAAEIDWQQKDAELRHLLDADSVQALWDAPPAPAAEPRLFDMDAPHSIIYTSGTTGRPKGAVLTYGNHWWSAIASALNLGLHADDCWLVCLPLFHVGGLSIVFKGVLYGMRALVEPRFDAARVNAAIESRGVTMVSVVSAMLERMLDDRQGRRYPPTLRCVLLGGGPAPLPLLERALALGAPVVQTYGLTETASQVVTLAPEDARRKVGSAGKPLLGTRLRITADGEICVLGPSVSPGYLHHAPRDGWLQTGDLGYLDEEGYLYVLDRRDDLIVSGGENVYPAEVESALLSHPSVTQAGVFSLPDPDWGRVPAAAVVLAPGANVSAEDLRAFCRTRLAAYKVPREIVFRADLPRTASGKLLRRALSLHP